MKQKDLIQKISDVCKLLEFSDKINIEQDIITHCNNKQFIPNVVCNKITISLLFDKVAFKIEYNLFVGQKKLNFSNVIFERIEELNSNNVEQIKLICQKVSEVIETIKEVEILNLCN